METRAQRIKAAFNDPKSAPDVIEYGNTDTAGYVRDGGLLDVTREFDAWSGGRGHRPGPPGGRSPWTAGVYGAPYFVGVRALYYRTDVFEELGLAVPASRAELISTAKRIRAAKPHLYGLAVGGAYTYGALPFLWADGGELATGEEGSYASAPRQPGRPQGHQGVHLPLRRRQPPGPPGARA